MLLLSYNHSIDQRNYVCLVFYFTSSLQEDFSISREITSEKVSQQVRKDMLA